MSKKKSSSLKSAVTSRAELAKLIDKRIVQQAEKLSFSRDLGFAVRPSNQTTSTTFQQMIYTESKSEVGSKTATYGPREDNTITITNMRLWGSVTANALATQAAQTVRFIVVSVDQAATPTIRQILDTMVGDGSTPYNAHDREFFRALSDEESNSDQVTKYKVLADKRFTVYTEASGIGPTEKYFRINIPLPKKGHRVVYSGPDYNDKAKGMIYGIVFYNGSYSNPPNFNCIQKIKYIT